jgi:hypothetical protein
MGKQAWWEEEIMDEFRRVRDEIRWKLVPFPKGGELPPGN